MAMKSSSGLPSVMKHDFSRVPQTEVNRSVFDRSHGLKTAFDSGYLVPIEVQEVLPSDDVDFEGTFFARLPATVTPPMDNIFLDTHWFFVPSRLLWTNFTKMMGERVNPKDSIDYLVPQINSGLGFRENSLADYFGIPTKVPNLNVSALPFRAYAKIWDDWFRDENLQDSIIQSTVDLGDSSSIDFTRLLKRGKRHDYFTACLPWTQRGNAVNIPLGDQAPVYGDGMLRLTNQSIPNSVYNTRVISQSGNSKTLGYQTGATTELTSTVGVIPKGLATSEAGSGLYADLSSATAATINTLRMAFQLQVFAELSARSGSRYVEILRSHFATICPDARLQRSEYLGGSSDQFAFTPIAQTASTDSTSPQGNLVAQGYVECRPHFRKAFTEHGYIIGLASVRCDLNYQQGLNRMWSRKGRYDYYWPVLQHLGEQAVLNKEIYAQGENVTDSSNKIVDDQPFGYQERYAEYRYSPSIITGRMRSNATQSLDVWHFAQHFNSLPVLNANFIQENPPVKRVLAVQDEPEILLDGYLKQKWTRPMACYSVPGLIDHL